MDVSILEAIQEADQQWFLRLDSYHSPTWDQVMAGITNKYTWFPFYVILGLALIVKFGWEGLRICLVFGLVILCCDQLTSSWMKPYFERLRPCHNPSLNSMIHLVEGCGGRFGFASSHAANAFGLAISCWLFLRSWSRWFVWAFLWAVVVSYSRVYMGVHYPLDILIGALIGIVIGVVLYLLYRRFRPRLLTYLPARYR